MLATLNIEKKVEENGMVVEPRVEFTNGGTWSDPAQPLKLPTQPTNDSLSSHPKHFECSIRPKSLAAANLLTAFMAG